MILLIILGILLFLAWLYLYIMYKLMCWSALILNSAGKMQTGNDLVEQVDKNLKEYPMPSFIGFWVKFFREGKKKGERRKK